MEKRIDRLMVETLSALPGVSDVVVVAPGICRAVRNDPKRGLQRLRLRLRQSDAGFEFFILDEDDPKRWAVGTPRGTGSPLEQAAHLTILGARWFDLDKPRTRPPGPDWDF